MEKTHPERTTQKKCSNWSFLIPLWGFNDVEEERLYSAYTDRQRQRVVPLIVAIGVLFQLFTILVPGDGDTVLSVLVSMFWLCIDSIYIGSYITWWKNRSPLAHIAWFILWLQLLLSVYRRVGDSYNELLGWAVVLQYITLASMPFHHILLILYSVLSFTGYLLVQYFHALSKEYRLPEDFVSQQTANGTLLLAATLLGGTAYAVGEKQQRSAFQVAKSSLRDKLVIEKESKEQERLLLSVLPEHVAVQMRMELGLIDTQFKKIYMSRHENVSILYADIVGFTAISSTYSAQDLVAILNELFARFDRLAEKYQQLRIKILGDCYYCISGAPVERPDHAVLCVHMGLSMVKAIKYVQQTTNSPVDMRVGIHTGAVLAGVLGQRQWQFDVYSRDVELANKMESSGMAGRVHISEATLGYLKDEFEVEPAHGERKEEMLRQAGIKTYFIVRVLKPYQGHDEKSTAVGVCEGGSGVEGLPDTPSDLKDDEDEILSPEEENQANDKEEKIHQMLEEELINRDDEKELAEVTNLCLTFKSDETERGFENVAGASPLTVAAPPLLLLPAVISLVGFAAPLSMSLHFLYSALIIEACVFNIVYYGLCRYFFYKNKEVQPVWKLICGLFNIGIFVAANITPLILCGIYESVLDDGLRDDAPAHSGARRCLHPSYFYQVGAGLCCGALWVSPLRQVARGILLLAVATAHLVPGILYPRLVTTRPMIDFDPYTSIRNYTNDYPDPVISSLLYLHDGRHIIMLFFIAISLIIFNRYTESVERARHSRNESTLRQAEQAKDMRRRNQLLVHNVLPAHVARHFMGGRHHHRDLYSQSYAEVGVLFASMPNFSEFYSEESVNNQGLECLRFLNEVISDFDTLLDDPRFNNDIIKIKTISSTYMAASGLNPTREMQPEDGVRTRWAHLACLVEFALELQHTLTAINEQSFNHFVLRLGVNHGPITAGVIGARKPHYDIWGNTVNVASRMESTGKAGCVQVTEETCKILEEFGYYFEQRGLVAVKGKGQLMTYYLQGKHDPITNTTGNNCNIEIDESNVHESLLPNGRSGGALPLETSKRTSPPQPDGADHSLLACGNQE